MAREPITIIEIDMEYCANTFGSLPCTAALSASTPAKCYNTYGSCAAQETFVKGIKTLRFVQARPNLPKGAAVYFPCLLSVSVLDATVNIAGSDSELGALGRGATLTAKFADFAYHDREMDKYQPERVSGAALFSGVGFDPTGRGTFWGRLRARWPHYAGRTLRYIQAELSGGAIINPVVRAFVITDFSGIDDRGEVTLEARDVVSLAESAVAPKASLGTLAANITNVATAMTLAPSGIGATYPASGRAVIGSEIVSYTRVGDAVTLTGRAVSGTVAAGHSAGDVFQQVLRFSFARVDDVLEILLRDYAGVPTSWIPKSVWAAEITRWAGSVLLTTDIVAPTGVAKLIGELSVLGFAIWPDQVAAKIGLKVNRPLDTEAITVLSDRNNLKEIKTEARAKDRLTEVYFYSVQTDPTKSATDPGNYRRMLATYDAAAKGPNAFADTKIKRVFCRWFNAGADGEVAILSRRLLNRFRLDPVRVKMRLDAKDTAIGLTSVLQVNSASLQDVDGAAGPVLLQVIGRSDAKPGHDITVTAQGYQFGGRYGFATANACPVYGSASAAQKARGVFAVNEATLKFADGSGPYKAI